MGKVLLVAFILTLSAVSMLTAPARAQTSTVLTFDNPVLPASPDSLLNGVFQGIDFGTAQWRWSGPFGADPTNNIYFDSAAGSSRTFSFSPAPRILNKISAYSIISFR